MRGELWLNELHRGVENRGLRDCAAEWPACAREKTRAE
jgi:hypothetical protein